MLPNTIKKSNTNREWLKPQFYKNFELIKLDGILLRGDSFITGTHHEVLIKLVNGVNIRVSRTNGEDTFQIGAYETSGNGYTANTLKSFSSKGGFMCKDVIKAFKKIHSLHPRYDQADCQVFARKVILEISDAKLTDFNISELEDDFI
ncbi:hypothetical protein [Pseudomonas monsensis]